MKEVYACKGSIAQYRRLDMSTFPLNQPLQILSHPECCCKTACRRVTIWNSRANGIDGGSDWLLKVIARVVWGDDCLGPEVEVDWKRGVILDLSGCRTGVSLELIERSGTVPTEQMGFGALSACCGAGAARGIATRTTAVIDVVATEPAIIPVPPFAYAVSFVTTDADLFTAGTTFIQSGSGLGGATDSETGLTVPETWLIGGGVNTIGVVNQSAALTFEAVFHIGV